MVGETVGHYQVTEKLGSGGMGVVYAAEDTRLGRSVALKFLPDEFARDATTLERFQREARATSALNHPHICTIYDVGDHNGHPFIVMERLRGQTLAARMAERPCRLNEVFDFGGQIADALEAAHANGIVHRDIKPANIFVTDRGQLKVLDFGIAKLAAPRRDSGGHPAAAPTIDQLTTPGIALGTVAYMSPEQIGGEDVDARTDLYSLGIVLYEMTTGRPPFADRTGAALLQAILVEEPPSPSTANRDVPEELERILVKALDKDRRLRYQTAADLRADLARVRRSADTQRLPARTGTGSAAAARPARLRLIHPWEAVARDGREFAEKGAGIMYWFRVPLGGVSYPEGFRSFLQPALENPRVSNIRFVLDSSVPRTRETWEQLVLPLVRAWAARANRSMTQAENPDGGSLIDEGGRTLAWVFVDLSAEFSPCFKLFVNDPDAADRWPEQAQLFLATATRNARLGDGALHTVRIPDMILRAESPDDEELLRALSRTAKQWDFLFS
jgi:serine/threonine protein kinase